MLALYPYCWPLRFCARSSPEGMRCLSQTGIDARRAILCFFYLKGMSHPQLRCVSLSPVPPLAVSWEPGILVGSWGDLRGYLVAAFYAVGQCCPLYLCRLVVLRMWSPLLIFFSIVVPTHCSVEQCSRQLIT